MDMKVVGVVCSPRMSGNTEILVGEVLKAAENEGAQTELITLAGKKIEFCDACGGCERNGGQCHIQDDMQNIYKSIEAADGIVIGSPVWYWSVTGQAKTFLDRLIVFSQNKKLMNKVGAAVVVAGRQGKTRTLDVITQVMRSHRMVVADSIDGLGYAPGEIKKDERAMKSAWELGREMVQLIKTEFKWPEEFKQSLYRLVMDRYKVSRLPKQ